MMTIYEVGFSLIGSVQVQADSAEHAKRKILQMGIQELIECQSWFDAPAVEQEVTEIEP